VTITVCVGLASFGASWANARLALSRPAAASAAAAGVGRGAARRQMCLDVFLMFFLVLMGYVIAWYR
jgi:hypothetical protein